MVANDVVTAHERVMEPLCGKATCLEIALAFISAVQRSTPRYDYQLGEAIKEIQAALEAIKQTQSLAVELWRNNHDRASG